MEYRGEYYMAQSTGSQVVLFRSTDLVNWTNQGIIFTHPQWHVIWAPELHVVNGTFYLYISDLEGTCYKPRMRVATSDALMGPYQLVSSSAFDIPGAIDPSLFVSSWGDSYLLGAMFPAGGDGCGLSDIAIWKLSGPAALAPGYPVMVASEPDQPWEWIVNEGPQAI